MARRKVTAQEKKFGLRLQASRKSAGKSQQAVADAFGVSLQAVSGWERGVARPEQDKLVKLAELYGMSLDDLMDIGNGKSRRPSPAIPVISMVQAGGWTENLAAGSPERTVSSDKPVSKRAFALEITGTSMLPRFQEGDVVIIDPAIEPVPGDFVVAKLDGEDGTTFKQYRIRSHSPKVIELHALNELFGFHTLEDDRPGRIIGPMVEHHSYRP